MQIKSSAPIADTHLLIRENPKMPPASGFCLLPNQRDKDMIPFPAPYIPKETEDIRLLLFFTSFIIYATSLSRQALFSNFPEKEAEENRPVRESAVTLFLFLP